MKIGLKTSLRIILSFFIITPVIFSLIIGLKSTSHFAKLTFEDEIAELGSFKSVAIDNAFNLYKSELSAAASFDFIVKTGAGFYAEVKDETTSYINNTVEASPFIFDIAVTLADGSVMSDYIGRDLGAIFPGHLPDLENPAKNDLYISKILVKNSEHNSMSTFYMTKPLYYDENPTGFIHFTICTNTFSQLLVDGRLFGKGEMYIADGKDSILGIYDSAAAEYRELKDAKLMNLVKELKEDIKNTEKNYEKFDTGRYIGVYGILPDINWYWIVAYPVSGFGSLYLSYYLPFAFAELGLAALCFIIMFYVTKIIISPMHEIILGTKTLNDGKANNIKLHIKSRGEFKLIAETLNTLIENAVINEELYKTISNISDNVLFEWDAQKETMFASDDFHTLFDIDFKTATLTNGNFIDSLMDSADAEKYKQDMSKLLKTESELFGEYLMTTKQGKELWFSVRAKCVTNRLGVMQRIIGFVTDIDREKKLSLQLSERASYDFLTKLYNRNTFLRELQLELQRTANPKIAVLFIDIDDFKQVNDKYGHGTGDELIKYVSSAAKAELKDNGFAGRFGGDEFVLCVTDPEAVDRVEELASRLLAIYNEGCFSELSQLKLRIKISIGISKAPEHGKTTDAIIAAADEAMYFVKKHGKSNYHIYDPADINLGNMM